MLEEPFDAYSAEREVRAALRSVRLVFELGFPEELVSKAERVIDTGGQRGTNLEGGAARYPASWVLTMVSKARSFDGNSFWERSDMSVFGVHDPTRLAGVTKASMNKLGLETFEDIIAAENAHSRLTPVLMHAGIPTENVPALLDLIAGSSRRHRFGAEEQLSSWLESKYGLRGLWRAPQLLFKYGGAMAVDLLDRFNEALAGNPEESGLPAHLLAALEQTDDDLKLRARSSAKVPRPVVVLDPWSGQGPTVRLPAAGSDIVTSWQLTGTQIPEVASRRSDLTVALGPAREWDFTAVRNGNVVGKWRQRPYEQLPVVLFSARNGRQLKRRGGRVDVDGDRVFALVHPKAQLVDVTAVANAYPPVYGPWADWKLQEIDVSGLRSITVRDLSTDGKEERIALFRDSQPPQLLFTTELSSLRAEDGTVVLASAPVLNLQATAAAAQLVRVVLRTEQTRTELTLDDLGPGPNFELGPALPVGETVGISVSGPIGLRLSETTVLVIPCLEVDQTPSVAIDSDEVTVSASTGDIQASVTVPAYAATATLVVGAHTLTAVARRVWWAVTAPSQLRADTKSAPFLLTADELRSADAPVFTLSTGSAVWSQVEVRDGERVLMRVDPGAALPRWSRPLSLLADTVAEAGVQSLDVVAVIEHRPIHVGRIISAYRPTISNPALILEETGGALAFDLAEEKPFKNRVARVWLVDRPWEPSLRIPLDDGRAGSFRVSLTSTLRSGRYRLAVLIEDPWSPEPELPRPGQSGAVEITLAHGLPLDPSDPLDSLLEVLFQRRERTFDVDSVRRYGHLLVALLNQQLRDEGPAGLSGIRASRVLHAFDSEPGAIVGSVLRAINDRAIRPDTLPLVSLALLPTVLHHEQTLNLHLNDDITEQAWIQVPLLSAAVEPWTDGGDSTQRWTRHLGWPLQTSPGDAHEDRQEADELWEPELAKPLAPRQYQSREFDHMLARLLDRPELRDFVFQTGALSDQVLSVDGERLAIIDCIERVNNYDQLNEWFDRHSVTVDRCDHRSTGSVHRVRIESYRAREQFETPLHQLLRAISALAAGILVDREVRYLARNALVDAMEHAPLWVTFCILQALADDAFEHRPQAIETPTGDH